MTPKQLTTLLKKWQKLLRLQDWSITAELVLPDDFPNDRQMGECNITENHKIAHIKLLSPDYWTPELQRFNPTGKFLEETLVHELLHIPLHPFANYQGIELEQFLNQFSTLLVARIK